MFGRLNNEVVWDDAWHTEVDYVKQKSNLRVTIFFFFNET